MQPAKFTFDTEFRGASDVASEAARARQKKTLTIEEIETMRADAQAEGTQAASVRAAENIERAGKILREDMEAMGPVRLKDVDEAQMRMVNVAKDLANKGEIMIASKQEDDELIY